MRGSGKTTPPVVPGAFTQTSYSLYDAFADINVGVHRDILSVVGKGYVRSLLARLKIATVSRTELIIEIDGVPKSPYVLHASGLGICDQYLPITETALTYLLDLVPMWRFETSFKVRVYGNHATATSIGMNGSAEIWTE